LWHIDTDTFYIDKKLRKFKSDKAIVDGFKRAIKDLAASNDPRQIGELKHGKYRYCYAIHITKSHSLVYRVFMTEKVIQLIDLDDHKNLYGRDNKP
jgi:mRNA-degrading endonuclease YafQ of YafQ-DinJ toxin-antitoxin module